MSNRAKRAVEAIHDADRDVTHRAAKVGDRRAVRIAGRVADLADQPPLVIASAATIAAGLALGNRRLARAGTRMLASHALATAIKTLVKRQVDRTRPEKARADAYQLKRGHSDDHELNSFPSGHTAGAVAVARAVTRDYPGAGPAAALAAGAAGAIQLPNAKHYASDVAAGALIGWAAERAASALLDAAIHQIAKVRRRAPA